MQTIYHSHFNKCIMCHVSCVRCHISGVTCHMSHVTCHLSPATCHLSLSQQPQPQTLPLLTLPLCTVGKNEILKYMKKGILYLFLPIYFVGFMKGASKLLRTYYYILFTPTIKEPHLPILWPQVLHSISNCVIC